MMIVISNCQNHQSFFIYSITDITQTCFFLLFIASSVVIAPMTASLYILTVLMYANTALWAVLNRISDL